MEHDDQYDDECHNGMDDEYDINNEYKIINI